jgi:DNA-binding beta-propeller fold protein YncE
MIIRNILQMFVALASLTVCVFRAEAQANQGFTQQQFDDWEKEVQATLNDALDGGLIDSRAAEWSVDVCVQGKVVIVKFLAFPVGGGFGLASENIKTDSDCLPSVDANGNPLPYTSLLKSLQVNGLGPIRNQSQSWASAAFDTPRAAPASNPVAQLPLFRDIPFEPLYPVSSIPLPPHCDPSKNAQVLLVNHGTNSVTRLNACSGAVIAKINVVSNPLQAGLTPDGSTALVTSFDNAVNFINLSTNSVAFTLTTPFDVNPDGIVISPDGTLAYITSFNNNNPSVQVIDIAQRKITGSLFLNTYPQSVFITPDGSQLWITFPFGNEVDVIDTLTLTRVRGLSVANPYGIAFDSTGVRAFIASRTTPGVLTVIDTSTFNTITTVPVGGGAVEVVFAPDSSFLAVSGFDSNTLTIVNPLNYKAYTGQLPGPPMGLALVR